MTTCQQTGKLRFRNELEAIKRMNSLRKRNADRDTLPIRVYECPLCGGWHMTSQLPAPRNIKLIHKDKFLKLLYGKEN